VQCKQSAGGRRRRRCGRRSRRGRRCLRRVGERASGRRGRGAFGRPGLSWPVHFPGRLRRRAYRLQFGDDRIRIDPDRSVRGPIAGHTDHVCRNCGRLEPVHREADGEIASFRRRDADRAGRLAARSEGGTRIGARRRGYELNWHGRRRRLEGVPRNRGAAGQTQPCCGNHDDPTHDPPVTIVRQTAAIPGGTIRGSGQWRNRADPRR
jgi:hypothetical protein